MAAEGVGYNGTGGGSDLQLSGRLLEGLRTQLMQVGRRLELEQRRGDLLQKQVELLRQNLQSREGASPPRGPPFATRASSGDSGRQPNLGSERGPSIISGMSLDEEYRRRAYLLAQQERGCSPCCPPARGLWPAKWRKEAQAALATQVAQARLGTGLESRVSDVSVQEDEELRRQACSRAKQEVGCLPGCPPARGLWPAKWRKAWLQELKEPQEADEGAPAGGASSSRAMLGERPPPRDETPQQAVARLDAQLGPGPKICVLGGTSLFNPASQEIVSHLASGLSARLGDRACFVTGGMPGVQKVFAEGCCDGARLFHLVPFGEQSGFGKGQDIQAGRDKPQRKQVFGQLGDIYITVEGGPGVASEALAAVDRGASVVPLIRTGGASGGDHNFPPKALERPSVATEQEWHLIRSGDAPAAQSAAAAVEVVARLTEEAFTPIPEDETVAESLLRLNRALGQHVKICVLGGTSFRDPSSEELVALLAQELSARIGARASFVTGGMAGVQEVFAKNCSHDLRLFHLLPVGQKSGFAKGRDLHAGKDLDQRTQVFGQLGDIYVTVEGGVGTAGEASAAVARGAAVLPLIRSGGASAGRFDFPKQALQRPAAASPHEWAAITSRLAAVADSAAAAASIVAGLVDPALSPG